MYYKQIMDYSNIVRHYVENIKGSPEYNSPKPVKDMDLLLPEFKDKLDNCFTEYSEKYPGEEVYITETYRSNELQQKYFNQGSSKIRQNGMHHYGIAADVAFLIDGKFSYRGDYTFLRKLFKRAGLTVLSWELGHVQFIPVENQKDLWSQV